jgi:hypothetical protein
MPDIADILARAVPRERTVAVCLAGDLAGEADRLQGELESFADGWQAASMGDVDPRAAIVQRIQAVREEMRARSVEFQFRALGHIAYSGLIAAHPAVVESAEPYDPASFLPALLASCCIDPVMTAQQAVQLLDMLNDGQARELFAAALAVNEEPSPLPFS